MTKGLTSSFREQNRRIGHMNKRLCISVAVGHFIVAHIVYRKDPDLIIIFS